MKKNITTIIVSILFLTSLSSCKKNFLDLSRKDQISQESFFASQDDAEKALVGVYNTLIQNDDYMLIQKALAQNTWSDDAVNVWQGSDYNNIAAGSYSSGSSFIENNWTQLYRNIRRTNVFLTNIGKVPMDATLKKRYTAEVRFFRAYYYHQLVMLFGGVPLVQEPLDITELKVPRSKRAESVAFILADLDVAIAGLPVTPSQPGRITLGAAWALKSRVLLYEYRFKEAAAAAKMVTEGGQYGLYTAAGAKSYLQVFAQSNENNKEVLFDIQFTDQEPYGSPEQKWLNPSTMQGWGALNPLKSLVDEFEDAAGKPISSSTLYNPARPFENRDPRLEMSIIHDGSQMTDNTGTVHTINVFTGPDKATRSGYYPRKNADPESFAPGYTSGKNYILIRYAEVLLNYAEAQNEDAGPDATVYKAINDIRSRAGMPALVTGLSKSDMRVAIRHERRIELCLESQRFFDIKRWGIAATVMTGTIQGALDPATQKFMSIEARTFDAAKNYLFPIPQTQIDLTGRDVLLQNPGYGSPVLTDDTYPKPEKFQ
jgi:hypothetical protein